MREQASKGLVRRKAKELVEIYDTREILGGHPVNCGDPKFPSLASSCLFFHPNDLTTTLNNTKWKREKRIEDWYCHADEYFSRSYNSVPSLIFEAPKKSFVIWARKVWAFWGVNEMNSGFRVPSISHDFRCSFLPEFALGYRLLFVFMSVEKLEPPFFPQALSKHNFNDTALEMIALV